MKTRANTSPEELQEWWTRFRKTKAEDARNRLMEYYLPIVKYTAERMRTKLPDEVDVDDLISAGIFGLMDAINAFDVNRGFKFETYCGPRIRGAILDELRAMDWVPRLVRSRSSKLHHATQTLEAELGRKPNEKELAERMKISLKEFRKLNDDAHVTGTVSLNRKWFENDSNREVTEIDVLDDKRSEDPVNIAQRKDIKELATRGLNRAERLVILLYYFEEMTMREIGEALELSESRVSQMHSDILKRIRGQLEKRSKEPQTV